jgi:hypothetical protein
VEFNHIQLVRFAPVNWNSPLQGQKTERKRPPRFVGESTTTKASAPESPKKTALIRGTAGASKEERIFTDLDVALYSLALSPERERESE